MNKELPEGWKVRKLGDVCDLQNGFAFKSTDYVDISNTLIFRMSQIRPGGNLDLNHNSKYLPDNFVEKHKSFLLEDGDVVIAMTDMASETKILGLPTYFQTDGRNFLLNQRVGRLYDFNVDEIDVRFLRYMLSSPNIIQYYKSFGKGALQINLGKDNILNAQIPIPSKGIQQDVVSKIEELFSELDKGVENLKSAQAQLKVYRQSVLKWAFEGKLTSQNSNYFKSPEEHDLAMVAEPQEIYGRGKHQGIIKNHGADKRELPEGWKWVKLKEISVLISDGDHQAPPKSDFGIPFITISNVDKQTNKIDFSKTFLVTEEYYYNLKDNRRPLKGDILYTVTGSFGIPILVDFDKEFCFQRHIGLIRPLNATNQKWFFYLLQSPQIYNQAKNSATGTAQKTVALSSLRNFEACYCSLEEQTRIVQEIESRLSVADKMEETIQQSLLQAESLRQSILKKAFEGGLVK